MSIEYPMNLRSQLESASTIKGVVLKNFPHPQSVARPRRFLTCIAAVAALGSAGWTPPVGGPTADLEQIQPQALQDNVRLAHPDSLAPALKSETWSRLTSLDAGNPAARLDLRGGRFAALWPSEPMVPGAGNRLAWPDAFSDATATEQPDALKALVIERLESYLQRHQDSFRVDVDEIQWNVGIHDQGRLIQLHGTRQVNGVPVRGAGLTASMVAGNLVLLGTAQWGDVPADAKPSLSAETARERSLGSIRRAAPTKIGEAYLEWLPMAKADGFTPGDGYDHRLAWVMPFKIGGTIESYRVSVDAHTGETLELVDTNAYNDHRNVKGGVFPISNDGNPADGVEIAGWPMPYANLTHSGGTSTTDAGGNVDGVTGNMTTELVGPYITIREGCGALSETSAAGDLDLGASGGSDCTTPAGGSAGNTHSARTAFYELNRIAAQGRSRLPGNAWLQTSMLASLNNNSWCNAVWTGTGVEFYQTEAPCSNLGELAGVLDHEWGHGMDDNGTNGSVSTPGEGIADAFAALRLGDSCPGRGALANVCSGFGDPCSPQFGCTAARDIDWMRHNSQQPHDVAWVNANCNFSPHCQGQLTSESIWDLYKRDLPARHGMDDNTAMEVTTRLTFLGTDNVGSWFTSNNGNQGGCAADNGYQQFLVVDDDNGNLNDGTPHMQAIFDAFNRHGIACSTPTVQVSGCAGAPTTAPTVQISATDRGANLSWNAVAGATRYNVFRTDGVRGCGRGKTLVGEVTGTSFSDSGLQNDREYYYIVTGLNAADTCIGPASPCTTVTAGNSTGIFADGFESGDLTLWSSALGN